MNKKKFTAQANCFPLKQKLFVHLSEYICIRSQLFTIIKIFLFSIVYNFHKYVESHEF